MMTDDFLVVAPTGRDADVTAQVLRSADIAAVADADGTALFAAIARARMPARS
ncbi:hypothetical protein QP185_05075 [Sphingomonas aerolata]|uniref:hypothetical protein n=1 Tax=Sphingomonas aerolata TaxID=185951 RepID=UPI002FE060B7